MDSLTVTMDPQKLAQALHVTPLYLPEDCTVTVAGCGVYRPGLQLAGYYGHFTPHQVQAMGRMEFSYLASLSAEERKKTLFRYFALPMPGVVLCRGYEPLPEMLEAAEAHKCPLFGYPHATNRFVQHAVPRLDQLTCPSARLFGTLVDVYGVGVLLMGDSGIGKSETSLELIKRGHRLIADDAVDVSALIDGRLVGSAPELIRHKMEIRGVGIIDIKSLYGTGAVADECAIDLVIRLEPWLEDTQYERLGLDTQYTNLLDEDVPLLILPVKPGRNMAVIVEVAARNFRQKAMGPGAAELLERRMLGRDME